ncbi:MAG: MFS transporter, partial [Achromobacter marplatensis]|uniref:MFS transporter n=1 Tax=Achromobacter marplatensis TaxID=470868 RepID=UPI003D036FA6
MLMLYPTIGWMGCCLALAALTSVSWLQLLRYQEPTWPRPAQPGGYSRLIGFWRGPGRMRLLLLLLIYPAGSALAYSIVMPALVDAGWTLESIGLIVNVLGSLAGLAAALAYGRLLRRYSRRRAMVAAALLQWLGIAGLALPAMGWGGSVVAGAAVVAYFLLYNPAATVLATLMMDQSSQASPATDYTLQVSLSQCFVMVLTSAGAMLAGRIGYGGVIGVAVILALLAAIASLRWTPRAAV